MDAKITKKRLGHLLSYDWLKIVGLILAAILVWTLVFTTTATRALPSQKFTVSNYYGNLNFTTDALNSVSGALANKKLTHEVLETDAVDLTTVDSSTASQLLEARVAVDEIDVMFVSQEDDPASAYEETDGAGNKTTLYGRNYLTSFLRGYRHELFKIDDYLAQMQAYVDKYYEGGEINAGKIEEDFRARVSRMKDKRYKTEEKIQAGLAGEIDRIEKYKAALTDFNRYLDEGSVELVKTTYTADPDNEYDISFEGYYAINLCPDVEKMGGLSKYVSYGEKYLDENEKEQTKPYAEDMSVCFFNSNGGEECYRYEGLVYITHLIASVLGA